MSHWTLALLSSLLVVSGPLVPVQAADQTGSGIRVSLSYEVQHPCWPGPCTAEALPESSVVIAGAGLQDGVAWEFRGSGTVSGTEPRRVTQRLHTLRGWSHEQADQVPPRGP